MSAAHGWFYLTSACTSGIESISGSLPMGHANECQCQRLTNSNPPATISISFLPFPLLLLMIDDSSHRARAHSVA